MTTTEHQHFNIVHNNNVQTSTPTTTRTIQQQTYNGVNSSLNHHYNGQQRHKHPRTPGKGLLNKFLLTRFMPYKLVYRLYFPDQIFIN